MKCGLRGGSSEQNNAASVPEARTRRGRVEREKKFSKLSCAEGFRVLSAVHTLMLSKKRGNRGHTSSSTPNKLSILSNTSTVGRCHAALSNQYSNNFLSV